MGNVFKLLRGVLCLIMVSLFLGNVIAEGIGSSQFAVPIAALFLIGSFAPLQDAGLLFIGLNAKDIVFGQGRYNPGGITGEVYYAFIEDIEKWPDALSKIDTETAVEFEDLVTVKAADAFVFKAGKSFKKLYVTLETGELKYSLIGPRDGKSFSNSMEVSYPSNDKSIVGFVASSANRRMVFIVIEQNGVAKVLGTKQFPAQLETAEGSTGKLIEDANALVQTYLSKSPIPAAVYEPPILLVAAP
ncbi:hypothetical protein [Sphingobacterium anhuiense]|uniref:hypothetical protein n=1 Tax=Sphingobacterium anhuiense TaxID=493780 RepID=UPI003C2BFCB6